MATVNKSYTAASSPFFNEKCKTMLTTPQVREEVFSYVAFLASYDSTRSRKGFEPRTSGPLITEFVSVMEERLGDPFKTIRESKMTVT